MNDGNRDKIRADMKNLMRDKGMRNSPQVSDEQRVIGTMGPFGTSKDIPSPIKKKTDNNILYDFPNQASLLSDNAK